LILSASGLANTTDYRAAAIRRATEATPASFTSLTRAHAAWWSHFWTKSSIEIPDKALEHRYYLSHYCMASCSRLRQFPPGLYGWTLSEQTPMWGGAYFLNYNFYAPFYGLYAANHIEQAMPANDAIIDSIGLGRAWSEDEGKYERMCGNSLKIKDGKGILLPVSILPHGVTGAPTTWGQRSNAAYCCVPIASTWYSTYDRNFAKQAYPFVRATAEFWEDYLVLENGRYVDKNDAALENSGRDTNPLVSLAMIRLVMELATEMSTELGVDRDKHSKWADIGKRLSDYPTCTVGDLPPGSRIELPNTPETKVLPIFRYSESGQAWQNDNAVGIQHIFPGNGIGLGKRPELLERARNQIQVMARWIDLNGCNSFYPAAVRTGYNPEIILQKLGHWTATASKNGMRSDNPHGTEQFSVVPCTLQEMLFQSHDHVLRFFPNWPKNQNARFRTLRAYGAFLVSADLKDGLIGGVKITSERGRGCSVINPWPGRQVQVTRNGKPAETFEGERFQFKTSIGEGLELKAK
jgi:alpha-L-fucosidase 2